MISLQFISIVFLSLIFLVVIYYFFFGPSKMEREIIKSGGLHPCFYCKKEISIKDYNCKFCKKQNYKGLRKGKNKYFLIVVCLFIFGLSRLHSKLGSAFI